MLTDIHAPMLVMSSVELNQIPNLEFATSEQLLRGPELWQSFCKVGMSFLLITSFRVHRPTSNSSSNKCRCSSNPPSGNSNKITSIVIKLCYTNLRNRALLLLLFANLSWHDSLISQNGTAADAKLIIFSEWAVVIRRKPWKANLEVTIQREWRFPI